MNLKWFFLLLPFMAYSVEQAETPKEACQNEIQIIEQQVQKLEIEKYKHQDLARQYQKLGDDWQYSSGNIQEGYRNWGLANQERKKAIEIQHQIDLLRDRKWRIMQIYPELEYLEP